MRVEQQEERSQDKADKTDTESQIVVMNPEFSPEADIAEWNSDICKVNMKKPQCKEIANLPAIGNQWKRGRKPIREYPPS